MAILETDILDVKIDPETNQLAIGPDGGFMFVSGLDGVAQLVRIAIRLYLLEWFLNRGVGMPWYQEILGETFDEAKLRARLAAQIEGVPGVAEVLALSVSFDGVTRKVMVDWSIRAEFGGTTGGSVTV